MDHFKHIYTSQASAYHQMILHEDVDDNLLPALERVTPLQGKRILDLGTGTGRIPLLTHRLAAQVLALDLHPAMLVENKRQRQTIQGAWHLVNADMRLIPLPDDWAQVTIAGWAIGHLRGWYPTNWRNQIGQVLQEMERVTEPGGALIIIETLTTGSPVPAPPTPALAEYYQWLEGEWGFTRQEIATDYHFPSLEEAITKTEFFFGATLAAAIREHHWQRLPEWSGVWGKIIPV